MEPGAFYDEAYFVGTDADAPKGYDDYFSLATAMERTHDQRLRRLRRLAPAARTLLDAGCGPGFFVRAATEAGLDARGLEVSTFAAHYGREQLHQDIVAGAIDATSLARIGGPFDLITLWDAIEHFPAPDEAVRLLAARLRPEGVLALSTGDIGSLAARVCGRRWHLFNLPEHLWFFTVTSLRHVLRRAGLKVVRVEREICWYTLQYLLDRLLHSLGRAPVRLPSSALHRLAAPVSLFDIVTVYAQKSAMRTARDVSP